MIKLTEKQEKEYAFFRNNLEEFLNNDLLKGKHVIIADEKIQKTFDTFDAAIDYAIDNFEEGTYIMQEIIDEREIISFTRTAVV